MPKLFVSYRRADSAYATDNLYAQMVQQFGKDNVFLDVGSIPFGVDFRKYLYDQIQAHDVVLVIIGPEWAQMMVERSSQPNDFVRIEIENALKLEKLVIPVLVMDADMPDFSQLPEGIQDLQWHNSALVRRQPDLEHDCVRLAEGIRSFFRESIPASTPATTEPAAPPVSVTTLDTSPPAPTVAQPVLTKTEIVAITDLLPPPFEWVKIPAGKVTLKYQTRIHKVSAFEIAKYPITVAQYDVFIKDGGYDTEHYWTPDGWHWRQENKITEPTWEGYDDDTRFQHGDHPVASVSWYEALAFCRWLGEKTGENILLPTEQQWQRAAQGDDERDFPWGNEFDAKRCNISIKSKRRGTSPVTKFPKGASPYGVMDMFGNVFEWTLTEYTGSRNSDLNNTNPRVKKGYAFYLSGGRVFQTLLDRSEINPIVRDLYSIGFRIART